MRRISRAWISMSAAMPWAPPDGWWTMIRLLVERDAHPRLTRGQQEAAHRRGLADADRADLGPDVLHRVVDREAGGDHAARRVDVHEDVLLRVLGLEEEQLGGDQRGHMVLDRAGDEDDPFAQQPRINVEAALAAVRLLDDDGNEPETMS